MAARSPLQHPNAVDTAVQMARSVLNLNDAMRSGNSKNCTDGKTKEFFAFCQSLYPHDPYTNVITRDKLYKFLFYQAFRQVKKRGGKQGSGRNPFDREGYDALMSAYDGIDATNGQAFPMPNLPAAVDYHPLSVPSFKQYMLVLKRIFRDQQNDGVNSLQWEQVWTTACNDLLAHVKKRTPHVMKATYQEKVDGALSPYAMVQHYPQIEQKFWDTSGDDPTPRNIGTRLRHRFCMQYTTTGVLRCESLYKAELSDFSLVRPPPTDMSIHPIEIMVNRLPFGKTNEGRILYGRAMRHKEVRHCSQGALAFYLGYRFNFNNELDGLTVEEWFNNEKWFDLKLLVDLNARDKTKEMNSDSYGRKTKQILQGLGLPCDKQLHLGRGVGAKILDLMEADDEGIRRMGNWNPSVYDKSYSTKLPMGPMRTLAGFEGSSKMYFNPRTTVPVPDSLLRCSPFGWAEKAWDAVREHPDCSDNPTCVKVLEFFKHLNKVFFQDAAAMLVLHPDRGDHPFFHHLAVLQTDAFKVSTNS